MAIILHDVCGISYRVNVDGESLQDRHSFDVMLVVLQFIAPLIVVLHYFMFEAKDDSTSAKRNLNDANEGRERASKAYLMYSVDSERVLETKRTNH